MSDTVLHGAHVLILEDEALINLAMADLLEEMGCRVSAFMHLHESLATIEREVPNAAVLDVNINGASSYALAERLQEKGVPIIFVTGYGSPSLRGKWNDFPHLYKPCAPAELKEALVKALTTGAPRE
jgi:CheY-like chemotaxis protein